MSLQCLSPQLNGLGNTVMNVERSSDGESVAVNYLKHHKCNFRQSKTQIKSSLYSRYYAETC